MPPGRANLAIGRSAAGPNEEPRRNVEGGSIAAGGSNAAAPNEGDVVDLVNLEADDDLVLHLPHALYVESDEDMDALLTRLLTSEELATAMVSLLSEIGTVSII